MRMNDGGRMVTRWCAELPDKFPTVKTDVSIVMPNHFHGILVITDPAPPIVGAALRGRPSGNHSPDIRPTPDTRPLHGGRPDERRPHRGAPTGCTPTGGGGVVPAPALGNVVDWFKTMTTNEYIRGVGTQGWAPFPGRLWQRGYYERIIRDDDELNRVRSYITANPSRWATDRENRDRTDDIFGGERP